MPPMRPPDIKQLSNYATWNLSARSHYSLAHILMASSADDAAAAAGGGRRGGIVVAA